MYRLNPTTNRIEPGNPQGLGSGNIRAISFPILANEILDTETADEIIELLKTDDKDGLKSTIAKYQAHCIMLKACYGKQSIPQVLQDSEHDNDCFLKVIRLHHKLLETVEGFLSDDMRTDSLANILDAFTNLKNGIEEGAAIKNELFN